MWPGAFVEGKFDPVLLTRHFVEEKFGLDVGPDRARDLTDRLVGLDVRMSEPDVHRALGALLGLPVRPAGGCDCRDLGSVPDGQAERPRQDRVADPQE